ncbi:MAG: TniB family NTP-binding protein [Clostridiales bacterium]|nr:TniB family NTP-binding protein [Clostridiales bacterium]
MEWKDYIAPMYEGEELIKRLAVHTEYNESIRSASVAERLMALSSLYDMYIPTDMSVEIYYKLYLALVHSLSRKRTSNSNTQLYENYKAIKGSPYHGILGGIDSFVITGGSGIGKSSAISRAISVISADNIIEIKSPYQKIIPFLVVQTPFDCSLKSLLLEILRKVDEVLGTKYLFNSLRTRATTDILIGTVSTAAMNHIGILVLDEIQNVANSKNGKNLVGSIVQLINSSGIAIVFAGTASIVPFIQADFMLARRLMNLHYNPLPYNQKFYSLCKIIFMFQFTKEKSELTEEITSLLYKFSQGNISVIISLIVEAQESAIQCGQEAISIETIQSAYKKRLRLLDGFRSSQDKRYDVPSKETFFLPICNDPNNESEHLFSDIVVRSKAMKVGILELLRQYNIAVEEVDIG